MPKLVKTWRPMWTTVCGGLSLACLLVSTADARAAEDRDRELDRFVPSFGVQVGVAAQRAEGHLATSDVLGDPVLAPLPNNIDQPIVPDEITTARDRMMTPTVALSVELMTPSWTPLPGSPRPYARVDVGYAFGPEYNMPSIGDPGPFQSTQRVSGAYPASSIIGQGGKLTAEVKPLWVTAGAGIAFTFAAWDRTFRFKPSVEYLREEVELSGLVRRAVGPAPNGTSASLSAFRAITLAAERTVVYHGVGPGLELEMDTGRTGPFVVSVYGNAKAWNFPDNKKKGLSDRNEFGETAYFEFLKNDWAFSGQLGIRFRWVPE